MKALVTTLLLCICSTLTSWAGIPPRPAKFDLLCDYAHVVEPELEDSLRSMIHQMSKIANVQMLVITVEDLEGESAAVYATEVGQKWGVGYKGQDNGIVMLIKPRNEKGGGEVFIAVGTGNEHLLTDALTRHIIETKMVPYLKKENYTMAIIEGVSACIDVVNGEYNLTPDELSSTTPEDESRDWWSSLLAILTMGGLGFYVYGPGRKKKEKKAKYFNGIATAVTRAKRDEHEEKARKAGINKRVIKQAIEANIENYEARLHFRPATPAQFHELAEEGLKLGLTQERIDEIFAEMKEYTLECLTMSANENAIAPNAKKAAAFGNDEAAIEKATEEAKENIRTGRSAKHYDANNHLHDFSYYNYDGGGGSSYSSSGGGGGGSYGGGGFSGGGAGSRF